MRGIFFDRDGTLIEDTGYIRSPARVRLLPGCPVGLKSLQRAGFRLVVISNQSGLGRGLITPEQAASVHREFVRLLEVEGVVLSASYYCPHAPTQCCSCRKPSPALVTLAARGFELDLSRSWFVGDRISDMETGERAGCRTVFLGQPPPNCRPTLSVPDWAELPDRILSRAA